MSLLSLKSVLFWSSFSNSMCCHVGFYLPMMHYRSIRNRFDWTDRNGKWFISPDQLAKNKNLITSQNCSSLYQNDKVHKLQKIKQKSKDSGRLQTVANRLFVKPKFMKFYFGEASIFCDHSNENVNMSNTYVCVCVFFSIISFQTFASPLSLCRFVWFDLIGFGWFFVSFCLLCIERFRIVVTAVIVVNGINLLLIHGYFVTFLGFYKFVFRSPGVRFIMRYIRYLACVCLFQRFIRSRSVFFLFFVSIINCFTFVIFNGRNFDRVYR